MYIDAWEFHILHICQWQFCQWFHWSPQNKNEKQQQQKTFMTLFLIGGDWTYKRGGKSKHCLFCIVFIYGGFWSPPSCPCMAVIWTVGCSAPPSPCSHLSFSLLLVLAPLQCSGKRRRLQLCLCSGLPLILADFSSWCKGWPFIVNWL